MPVDQYFVPESDVFGGRWRLCGFIGGNLSGCAPRLKLTPSMGDLAVRVQSLVGCSVQGLS